MFRGKLKLQRLVAVLDGVGLDIDLIAHGFELLAHLRQTAKVTISFRIMNRRTDLLDSRSN